MRICRPELSKTVKSTGLGCTVIINMGVRPMKVRLAAGTEVVSLLHRHVSIGLCCHQNAVFTRKLGLCLVSRTWEGRYREVSFLNQVTSACYRRYLKKSILFGRASRVGTGADPRLSRWWGIWISELQQSVVLGLASTSCHCLLHKILIQLNLSQLTSEREDPRLRGLSVALHPSGRVGLGIPFDTYVT